MPFTLSHPAAVLPLLRHPFSPAALVCGSLAPDMPYFLGTAGIPVSAQSWYEPLLNATTSHQVSGIGVPVVFGAVLLTAYALVRRPMTALLPARHSPTDGHGRVGGVRRVGWVLLSLVIGIVTHRVGLLHAHRRVPGDPPRRPAILSCRRPYGGARRTAPEHRSGPPGRRVLPVAQAARCLDGTRRGAGQPAQTTRRVVAATLSAAVPAGAAANTAPFSDYRGGTGPADRSGTRDVTEAVLSDWATGGGAALACAVLAYAGGWWAHRALRRTTARRSVLTG